MRTATWVVIVVGACLGLESPAEAWFNPSYWKLCNWAAEGVLLPKNAKVNHTETPLVTVPGCLGVAIGGVAMLPVSLAAGCVAGAAGAPFGMAKEAFWAVSSPPLAAGIYTGAVLVGGPFWLVSLAIPDDTSPPTVRPASG
jgi:hypothetical protein